MTNPLGMRERDVESRVVRYAKKLGWHSRKQEGRGNKGKTDRYFFRAWQEIIYIEFKAPGKKTTKLQQDELDLLCSCGFLAVVIDTPGAGKELFDKLEAKRSQGWD